MIVGTIFQLKLTIYIFLDETCPKTVFSFKNRKSELYHWNMQIRISLATKFQSQWTILIFRTNLFKGHF